MLKESFLRYLRFERNYSEHTAVAYGKDLDEFEEYCKEQEEGFDFTTVDADAIRGWAVSLMDRHYEATSVNRKLSSLRSFYHYLLREGKVRANPAAKVTGPKKKKPLPTFVRDADMIRLLDESEFDDSYAGRRDRVILDLFYETGIRLSELVGLCVADVDFSSGVIKVTGKRNKQRMIPFGQRLEDMLKTYLEARNEFAGVKSGPLFYSNSGRPIGGKTVYWLVRKHLSRVVAQKKKSPHVLRHTFATSMLNHGAELEAVKELMGHQRLSTTQVYTHTTFEELKKVYKQAHPRA